MDKKNLPQDFGKCLDYQMPPRLVTASQGWHIVFYQTHPETDAPARYRKSYNLGRIKSKPERRAQARLLCEMIAELLEVGYPFIAGRVEFGIEKFIALHQKKEAGNVMKAEKSLIEVVNFVAQLHSQSESSDTNKTYQSRARIFCKYLDENMMSKLPVTQFSKQHAQAYMDTVRIRVGANTYNNYRNEIAGLFNTMVDRGFIIENPFRGIKKLRPSQKKRRAFTADEATAFLEYVYENDWWLLVLVALHAAGCVRRTEAYRMRFSDVHLKEGYFFLSEHQCLKSKKEQVRTIPQQIRWIFMDERFAGQPKNWLIFGADSKPHPSQNAGENTWRARHRQTLLKLKIDGKIKNIEGLSLYSWKDTGLTFLSKQVNMYQLRDHAGHTTTEMTMRYYHAERIIPEVIKATFPFFEAIAEKQKEKLIKIQENRTK